MFGSKVNKLGKEEHNQKVQEGPCIFPFKFKWEEHNKCVDTPKGEICATSLTPRGTLKTYGYCKKGTKNKELKKKNRTQKLKVVPTTKSKRYNEEFIDVLDELQTFMQRKGDVMRARAYKKAQEPIAAYPVDITSVKQLEGMKGIGKTILLKLDEYVKTNTIKALEKERVDPLHVFTNIYGVGPKKAKDLIGMGITTLQELKTRKDEVLNETQKLGLQYYDDINSRIPRAEIDEVNKAADKIFEKLMGEDLVGAYEIVGSYRRKAVTSGDIDIIVTSVDGNPFLMHRLIDRMTELKMIKHKLTNGKTKVLVIGGLPDEHVARRIDFLYSPPDEYPFATLYFTGSKYFNTAMRQHAVELGFSLNEHGIYKIQTGKKEKIPLVMTTEKDIFDFLGLEYVEPENRKDARSLKIVTEKTDLPADKPKIQIKIEEKKETKDTDTKQRMNSPSELLIEFSKKGIKVLEKLSETEVELMIETSNELYTNDPNSTILSDEQYDILKEYMERKYPKNAVLQEIGAPVRRNKVKLPYQMPSMDKIKPETGALKKWMDKYKSPAKYVLSAKLDGVSGLYYVKDGKEQLFTRGNGTFGQDISHIIPYLKLPKGVKNIVIRGEFIISKEDFAKFYVEKAANARNLVAGIINRLKVDPKIYEHLKFVAYEVILPELVPSEQFKFLEKQEIDVVWYEEMKTLSNEMLSEKLQDVRTTYEYETDGIIVSHDKVYMRTGKNPDHAFAFKMMLSEQVAEAKVVDVIWTPSKDGYLKPRVQIEPIKLSGVTIEYATGKNAQFIEKNRIGVGAVIQIVRSGDVIPDIINIVKPAKDPLMPSVEYVWNPTHVDIMLVNKDDNQIVKEKNITGFFRNIGVDGLSSGNIKRIMKAGYDSVPKILAMNKDDFLKVEGFKEKLATKIHQNIKKQINDISLPVLMKATNIFGRGFGEKRIAPILDAFPNILKSGDPEKVKVEKLITIKGMARKTAENFVKQIPMFLAFMTQAKLDYKLNVKKIEKPKIQHALTGKRIVFSGFRPADLIKKIENVGGIMGSSVSKNTFAVIVKSLDETTGKADQARQLGVPIMTPDTFDAKYLN